MADTELQGPRIRSIERAGELLGREVRVAEGPLRSFFATIDRCDARKQLVHVSIDALIRVTPDAFWVPHHFLLEPDPPCNH